MSINEDLSEFWPVGRVKDAHGIRGEVYIKLRAKKAYWEKKLDRMFLVNPDQTEAHYYEIERSKPHKEGFIVKFKEIENRNEAEALKGHNFFLPRTYLQSNENDQPFLLELLDLKVVDDDLGKVGEVKGFSYNGAQDLLIVKNHDREILIPFIPEFLRDIDFSLGQINMTLPEGLIDIQE